MKHYTTEEKECKDIITDMGLNPEFYIGNVIKYLYRYRTKGTPVEDLKKAREYIDFLIELQGSAWLICGCGFNFTNGVYKLDKQGLTICPDCGKSVKLYS